MKKQYIFIFLILIFLSNQTILAQYLLLSQPIYQSVYQRDNANAANIPISGQVVGNSFSGSFKIEAITNLLDANGATVPLTTITTLITNSTSRGVFNGTINRSKGWYSVQIKFTSLSNGAVSSSTTKCGVGDVFIVAGQSNGQGDNGATPTTTSIPEWIVGNNEDWNCRKEFEQRPTMSKINGTNRVSPSGNNA